MKSLQLFSIFFLGIGFLLGCNSTANMQDIVITPPTSQPEPETLIVDTVKTPIEDISTLTPPVPTSTAILTLTPSLGILVVDSFPDKAYLDIEDLNLHTSTPFSDTVPVGVYTITLSLAGYETVTETIQVLAEDITAFQKQLDYLYQFVPLEDLTEDKHLTYLNWELDEHSLIYAIEETSEDFFYSPERKDWQWWRYDLITNEKTLISPPQSRVSEEVRTALNLCPSESSGQFWSESCPGFSLLFESPVHDHVVFTPLTTGDGETWLAEIDGTNVKKLDTLNASPSSVQWSSDGHWLIISLDLPGPESHYLISTENEIVEHLGQLTDTSHTFVTGLIPQFSPSGQKLAFVGSSVPNSRTIDDYGLYILDLETFEVYLVSKRVGLFHWADNEDGLYILDKAMYPLEPEKEILEYGELPSRTTNLYYIDLTQTPAKEQLIADNIYYVPQKLSKNGVWGFSLTNKAIAYTGFNGEELGILMLNP